MGELEKRLTPMFETYFDDRYEFKDILRIIDEAKKDFPQYYIEESKDFKEGCYAKIEHDDFFDLIKWFKKWFGVKAEAIDSS